jgi:hypothetical protein
VKKDVLGAFTRFVLPIGARSRGATGALDCKKICTVNHNNREIARLPIASSVNQHNHNQRYCRVGYCTSEKHLVYSLPY